MDKIKYYFKNYLRSTYLSLVQNPPSKFNNNFKLNFETTNRILAFHCAHVSFRQRGTVNFDSDAVEAILDTGCSTSISFERSDFINYKPMKSKVEGLGIHNIVGTGTIKYTVLDDNGDKVNLLVKNAIHVPTMDVRLLSLQQVAQQCDTESAGGDVRADACYLRWNGLLKTVPYQKGSNLPILYTLPGGSIAEAYITKHTRSIQVQVNAYLVKEGEQNPYWDKSLIHDEYIKQKQDEATIPTNNRELSILKPSKYTSKPVVQPPPKSGLLEMAICGDCTMQDPNNGITPHSRECGDCEINFDNLSQPSRLLLHYHNKLDHMGFKSLRDLAQAGFLPQ